ncbi:unnamed protein product [Paramecium octaurelia]|uniref:Uncharacterized protein n=1 Tax=Paramecium octaurelia TaxID=43137 RepID=A0A8S1Y6K3_PAROT|nr:unnamed protein product [Paramecium octaurelia]
MVLIAFQIFWQNEGLGIQQYMSPHTKGPHNGETRIVIEMGYYGEYVDIARRSLELWRQQQDTTSEQIIEEESYLENRVMLNFGIKHKSTTKVSNIKTSECTIQVPIKTAQDQSFYFDKYLGLQDQRQQFPSLFIIVNQKEEKLSIIADLFFQFIKAIEKLKVTIFLSQLIDKKEIKFKFYTDLGVFRANKLILSHGMGLK